MQARASVLKEDDEPSEALGRVSRGVVMRERNVEMDAAHYGFSLQYMGPPLSVFRSMKSPSSVNSNHIHIDQLKL
jgi:hypothetical protein